MKKPSPVDHDSRPSLNAAEQQSRESNWCAKFGYFIDLDACQARSFSRPACRRCYKSLLQLSFPF
ncbi:MAG: hypothetical protein CVU54_17060 [Deltaproteobacteria bacterium HGW-Deltaproteobacteria-12]|jgi:hypothetical protein|nr:MAG: hypothetical protein CVU54_17060 [Deltaproteobacteria bacterium HGW-Deltaproteobacteria-12]